MHPHHHHDHGHGHSRQRSDNKKSLTIALLITSGIMLLEFAGGLITKSLALLSDSGHMLSDAGSLALSLIAMWFAVRPPSPRKTYGYYRFEILAALFNGVTLFMIAGFIIWEAVERFLNPPSVAGGTMMIIAAIGLVANLVSAWVLMRKGDVKENVNLRSAYLHVLGDALGSIGALIAGLLMFLYSWYIADPVISVMVALLIFKSAWGVISHSLHILMEGTPVTVDRSKVEEVLQKVPGVKNVHDLHIWTITSGLDSLSCHLLVEDEANTQQILQMAIEQIEKHFSIQHTTIQVETSDFQHHDQQVLH
ncbi:cation diffusion facilitator family transporter [Paenactinomyces guangxiensis]|uniref:Cation transporter n=1 Tax=Paenactinomyces guangxiensis TaxID=1490290 RepID=A0A7W2A7M7_9BACL|nr:cation diffusion facilitator family transporter [Paenactinomyces guangxiensis]MBA4492948.1 cation transporter [Paenactinomyces guangxiensis]MBH8590203.1 cation transporter [Paenactinomyces guangxiensis]